MEKDSIVRIVDKRNKEKFFVDDEYLNGYARYVGTTSSMVYFVLCRHADKEQSCFPSLDMIGEKIGVKRHTVMRSINLLCEWKIIEKSDQERQKNGTWKHNTYLLLDKTMWKKKAPCSTGVTPSPCSTGAPNRVASDARTVLHPCDTKEPHREGTTYKETSNGEHCSREDSHKYTLLGAEVLKAFEEVDAKNKTYYGNKTQRKSADFLISEYGFNKVLRVIKIIPKTNQTPFMPKINSPYDLKEKWQKLSDALRAKKTESEINTTPKWKMWT